MAGLVSAIPPRSVAGCCCKFRVSGACGDARDRPGHDGWGVRQSLGRLVVRRETDKEQEVKVLYGEDLASHAGPAPCVVSDEGQGEASAGERAGWPLSRVRPLSRVPTGLPTWKATRPAALPRAVGRRACPCEGGGRGQRPQHAWTLLVREPRDLILGQWRKLPVRVGKVRSRSRRCTGVRSQTWP
jgi:hypothetical protein